MFKWLTAGAAIALAVPLALLFLVSATATPSTAATGLAGDPSRVALADIPPSYLELYLDAAQTCPGLPWGVLAGIGTVESDNGQSDAPGVHSGANFAGAEGPMQFEPATFAEYAVDADHSVPLSVYDPADAIYTAAAMLCADDAASGTQAGISQAVFAYNHSDAYVADVLAWAARYSTPVPGAAVATAISFTLAQLGKPYQWGAAGPNAYDCSGLVYAAYAAAGIRIARTTFQWYLDGPQVPLNQHRARRPAVLRWLGRHANQPRPRRDVPRRRPDHPGAADRPGRPDRPARPGRGRGRHPPRRPARQLNAPTGRTSMTPVSIAQLRATATVDLMTAAAALGLGRTRAYELARRNQFPCRVIRIGDTYRIPTPGLLELLGVTPEAPATARPT